MPVLFFLPIKVRAIKKNSKGVNKRKNKITCQCIVF